MHHKKGLVMKKPTISSPARLMAATMATMVAVGVSLPLVRAKAMQVPSQPPTPIPVDTDPGAPCVEGQETTTVVQMGVGCFTFTRTCDGTGKWGPIDFDPYYEGAYPCIGETPSITIPVPPLYPYPYSACSPDRGDRDGNKLVRIGGGNLCAKYSWTCVPLSKSGDGQWVVEVNIAPCPVRVSPTQN